MTGLERIRWAIAEGYLPSWSTGPIPGVESEETLCLLNAGEDQVHGPPTASFADREPAGPYPIVVAARRTLHVRLNELDDPEPLPRGRDFTVVVDGDVPIVVQHTRLDSHQPANALMTTIAFGSDG